MRLVDRMNDITEWMTVVGDSNNVYKIEFDRIEEIEDVETRCKKKS